MAIQKNKAAQDEKPVQKTAASGPNSKTSSGEKKAANDVSPQALAKKFHALVLKYQPTANIIDGIADRLPMLKTRLVQANFPETPREYVTESVFFALYGSVVLFVVMALSAVAAKITVLVPIVLFFVVYVFLFFYRLKYVEVLVNKRARRINRDLLYAGRHLLIELKAGIPLFNAMYGVTEGYGEVSEQFKQVIKKINTGIAEDIALQDVADNTTSQYFRRLAWQMISAMRSGSDMSSALDAILDQISKEQIVEIKKYGQKLNPIAMFYMIMAVILPSLGITLGITLAGFVGVKLSFSLLLLIGAALGFMQYMFLTVIKSARPDIEM